METVQRESDLNELAQHLFTNSAQPANSIQLQTELLEVKDLFNMLLELFLTGMNIMFKPEDGSKIDIESLSTEQVWAMQQRLQSIGFQVFYEVTPIEDLGEVTDVFDEDVDEDNLPEFEQVPIFNTVQNLDELETNSEDKLSDYHFTVHAKNNDYRIWFDHYLKE